MKIVAVTSFHAEKFEEYGRKMIETFDKFWPRDIKLIVYYQGAFERLKSDRIEWRDLDKVAAIQVFKSKFAQFREANGHITLQNTQTGAFKNVWDYRFDAIRFSHKVFSILDAIDLNIKEQENPPDITLWIDADTFTTKDIDLAWLERVLPKRSHGGEINQFMTYLGRKDDHSEAGWLGFNMRNALTEKFFKELRKVWLDGSIFALKEWHDSYVFDWLRENTFKNSSDAFVNIAGDGHDTVHPFVNSVLGERIDHLKGHIRKIMGSSRGTETVNPTPTNIKEITKDAETIEKVEELFGQPLQQ